MHAPQITIIILWALSLGSAIAEHGQPKTGRENAWVDLTAIAIVAAILYWGGFFSR